MISKKVKEKAENLEVVVTDETNNSIYAVVGYGIRFNKKLKTFICNCKTDSVYNYPICSHKIAFIKQCKTIPQKIKDALDKEEIR